MAKLIKSVTISYGYNSSTSFPITLKGITVPLPFDQVLYGGITVDNSNSVFTVPNDGVYSISYYANFVQAELVATAVSRNDILINGSLIDPSAPQSIYANEVIVELEKGDNISLQFIGEPGINVTLGYGTGASMIIKQLK